MLVKCERKRRKKTRLVHATRSVGPLSKVLYCPYNSFILTLAVMSQVQIPVSAFLPVKFFVL